MKPIGCPETSVRNYHYSLRNNPEGRSPHLLGGGIMELGVGLFNFLPGKAAPLVSPPSPTSYIPSLD